MVILHGKDEQIFNESPESVDRSSFIVLCTIVRQKEDTVPAL